MLDPNYALTEILKNIPPQIIAFLLVVLFFGILSRAFPRRRHKPQTHKPQGMEPPLQESREKRDREPLNREEKKGQRGEDLIADILDTNISGEFQLFRNVYVPNGDKTSEIDLLMVHEKGIVVFESKNYSGWIFGSMDGLNWLQRFPNGEKHSFYNPVRQNRNHIKALSQHLNIPESQFYSYVVFSDKCALKKVAENTRFTVITQTSKLAKQLQRTLAESTVSYNHEEIQAISERLIPLTNVDSSVKAKHIEDIRAAQESTVCPFCGAELVIRHGKYGDFWGCSSYPKCKFKRKIEE